MPEESRHVLLLIRSTPLLSLYESRRVKVLLSCCSGNLGMVLPCVIKMIILCSEVATYSVKLRVLPKYFLDRHKR